MQAENNVVKLNLGCYNRKMPNFTNVDILEEFSPDVLDDVSKLEKFKDNSVDLIYASHLLEHFKREEVKDVLKCWFRVLKKGGVLRISVPDFGQIVKYYLLTQNLEDLMGLLYAGQKNAYDVHYIAFDYKLLTEYLKEAGFSQTYKYDCMKTDHAYIDDHSQAFLPHMDKVHGMLMSLHIEAIK